MKLLHIIAGAKQGGAESCAVDTIRALAKAGIKQTVICRPHPAFMEVINDCQISYYPLTFNRFLKWPQMARINRIITAEKPELIHSWMNRAANFTPRREDIPTLGWFGGYYNLKNYATCDFFMGVTKDIVRYISNRTKKPDCTYLGHAFGTLAPAGTINRADFGIPQDAKVVLLLSRMHWKKGVDLLIDAASRIDNVYFLLAGDGPEIEKYKLQARNLGLERRVIFPGWCIDRLGMLNIADVCVLPSRYEPFGIVIPEAWFAGVPLVATKAAGASQYVTDEADGLLIEIDDCDGLVTALNRALHDKTLRHQLITGGKATYKAHFSRDVVIDTMISSYEDMIERYQAGL